MFIIGFQDYIIAEIYEGRAASSYLSNKSVQFVRAIPSHHVDKNVIRHATRYMYLFMGNL